VLIGGSVLIDIARDAGVDTNAGRRGHRKVRIRECGNSDEAALCPGIEVLSGNGEGRYEEAVAIAGAHVGLAYFGRSQRGESGIVNGEVLTGFVHIAENFYGQRYRAGGSRRQADKEERLVFSQHFIQVTFTKSGNSVSASQLPGSVGTVWLAGQMSMGASLSSTVMLKDMEDSFPVQSDT